MSWSIHDIETIPAPEARGKIDALLRPHINASPVLQGIADYIDAAIVALQSRHGENVTVTVTAHGYLFDGAEGNYETTTASLNVLHKSDATKDFAADDYAHTANLLRSSDEASVRATLSNNINIILSALHIARMPYPDVSEEHLANCEACQAIRDRN